MTEVPQETAERLALRARRSMDSGDLSTAIEQQNAAVELRKQELARLEEESPTLTDERREAAHRLSDYLGRLGGMYRRDGRIADGIDAYRDGKDIEQKYRLDDSYNLTNWIVLQLLDDPTRLKALAGEINHAIALIGVQVEGPRRGQWWAWADLGQLCLLGRRPREAREAYERFQQAGPRRVEYQSVLAVLGSLQEQFMASEPDLAADLDDTIKYLESASAVT
jgi:tetratricopeptide (TPR) repeat protein